MADQPVTVTTNANVEAIVKNYKDNLPSTKVTSLQNKLTSSIFGEDIAKIATWYPKLLGGILDKIFGKKSIWSTMSPEDKTNLIDSLAQQTIYTGKTVWANYTSDVEVIKMQILVQLMANSIIDKDQKSTFWEKNPWAVDHVKSALNDYIKKLETANQIADVAKSLVVQYDSSKKMLKGATAIYNMKSGMQPSQSDREAIEYYIKAVSITKEDTIAANKTLKKG